MRTSASQYVRIVLAAVVLCSSVSGQQQTPQRTPWHISKVFTFTHEGQAAGGGRYRY